jgi:hypothetical protein
LDDLENQLLANPEELAPKVEDETTDGKESGPDDGPAPRAV